MSAFVVNRECSPADYRGLAGSRGLVSFDIHVKQTDLRVAAETNLRTDALTLALEARAQVEGYIERRPEFLSSLVPLAPDAAAPPVVAAMMRASQRARVGPMAAVAGAIAEHVGRGLSSRSYEIIVENGGDLYLRSSRCRELSLLAENTLLTGLRIAIPPLPEGAGIATSAGTLGHSLSFGRADAVMILAESSALADALATAVGNIVLRASDIEPALSTARELGALAAVIIADGHLGACGDIELIE